MYLKAWVYWKVLLRVCSYILFMYVVDFGIHVRVLCVVRGLLCNVMCHGHRPWIATVHGLLSQFEMASLRMANQFLSSLA